MNDDSQSDDDLEAYIAAGIDVPTAMVLAEEDATPKGPRTRTGSGSAITIGVVSGVLAWLVWLLAR